MSSASTSSRRAASADSCVGGLAQRPLSASSAPVKAACSLKISSFTADVGASASGSWATYGGAEPLMMAVASSAVFLPTWKA